jgi:hypothetical protein
MLRKEWNVPQSRLAAAIRGSIRIKNQRRVTYSRFGPAERVEEVLESTKRKLKKMFLGQSVSYKVAELERQYDEIQRIRLQIYDEERSLASGWDSRASNNILDSRHSAVSKEVIDKLQLKPDEMKQTNDGEVEEAPKEQRKFATNDDKKLRDSQRRDEESMTNDKASEVSSMMKNEKFSTMPIGTDKEKQITKERRLAEHVYNPHNDKQAEDSNCFDDNFENIKRNDFKNQQRWEDKKEEFDSRNKVRKSDIAPVRSYDSSGRNNIEMKASFNGESVLRKTHSLEMNEADVKKHDKRRNSTEAIFVQAKAEFGKKKTNRDIEEEKVEIGWGKNEKEALGTSSDDRLEL